ncbi:small subunit ribosomal protein S20 [Kandleria vitulina]|uniref:Small ribosomal subunit protein bS20 n=1 Tax=Kandleria vitulina TaxID=1630 RepID=A0A1H2UJA1_9FIRM|nr:30S ribosomal protein S20 [Kandleria vitulina]SDW55594.1 small subunit ribosomal protein S20 [Kandleria vitulina]HAD23314.1 30S ribosomal protein S20 [Kandleria vitulina]
MANMKQQIKRYKNADKKHAVNVAFKSSLKTSIKKTINAIEAGNKEEAVALFNATVSKLDSSVSKGIHHKNYASRQKSKLQKKINTLG